MLAIAILAAGKGTRMKSQLPKVLHPLAGKSLIDRVLSCTQGLKPHRRLIVVGHQANLVEDSLKNSFGDQPKGDWARVQIQLQETEIAVGMPPPLPRPKESTPHAKSGTR